MSVAAIYDIHGNLPALEAVLGEISLAGVDRIVVGGDVLPVFEGVKEGLIVCGHTHMQFDRRVGSKRVINAGSVGQPFGQAGAFWLVLGPEVVFRQTLYDLTEAANRIRATGYPQAQEVARDVLRPVPEAEVLELYGKAEVK